VQFWRPRQGKRLVLRLQSTPAHALLSQDDLTNHSVMSWSQNPIDRSVLKGQNSFMISNTLI
jgi:hypothetical protein